MLRLVPITPALAAAAADPDAFARLAGARLGDAAAAARAALAQSVAHQAPAGASPPWGGFLAVDPAAGLAVGVCAFVAPPDPDGAVEIAYHTFPPHEGQGYGGAMAGALVARAQASGAVRVVVAHTLPEANASTRILARHGFARAGEGHDADVGPVWRWERALGPA